ncbi:MAG: Hpt domain-containing protein [Pseudomonadota bacterium]
MTMTDNSQAPQFDTGPLSWVMGEIRDALGRSQTALLEASERTEEAQASSLKHAKAYLHQAHGALQMVDVDGVGVMTECAEQALDRFRDALLPCTQANAQVVGMVYQAVIEYLEELLTGGQQQPARLFPYYRTIQEMLGAARIHPADLFFPDLSVAAVLPQHANAAVTPDYPACRTRFEKALLPFLKSTDIEAQRSNALAMQEAIALIAAGQKEAPARTFWIAMQSFAELVANRTLTSDLYVKQLFGMINLQIRRLTQGEGSLPEAMMRDALFFVAAAPNPSPAASALRRAYRLEGMVPADYDKKRYGRIDADSLKAAKEALVQAQHTWDKLAAEADEKLEADFETQLGNVAIASERLGAPALPALQREMVRAAKQSFGKRNHLFSIEMATAMLFVEHGLDQIRQLPEEFDAHAQVVAARLLALAAGQTPPPAPKWQGDLSQKIQQGQTVTVLAAEMKNGLRQVEKVLDDYYADSSKRATLSQIDPVLHQLHGAVAMLDQEDAMRAAQHVKDAVRALAAAEGSPELEAASLQNIARNIGALGFFVDMMAKNFDAAKERFTFDLADGMLREVPFEKVDPSAETQFEAEPVAVVEVAAPEVLAAPAVEIQAPAPVVLEAAPAPAVAAPIPMSAPPVQVEGEVEAELLEIFIMEAQEVLALVTETLPALDRDPSNQETITVIRRAFHTLKGSGRMVGLNNFGEGAAYVEKVMNLWLSEGRAATPDLLALLGWASVDMSAWVEELVASGTSARSSERLVAAAARMLEGEKFSMDAAAPVAVEAPAAPVVTPVVLEAPQIDMPAIELPVVADVVAELPHVDEPVFELPAIDEPVFELPLIEEPQAAAVAPSDAPALEAPSLEEFSFELPAFEPPLVLEPVAQAPAESMPTLELEQFAFEPAALEPDVAADPTEQADAEQIVLAELPHSDAPQFDDAEFGEEAGEVIEATSLPMDEDEAEEIVAAEVAEFAEPEPEFAEPVASNIVDFPLPREPETAGGDDNIKRIGHLEIPLPLYNIYINETDEIMRLLSRDFAEWRHEPQRLVTPEALKAAHTLAGTSATVGFSALCEVAHALEMALDTPAPVLDSTQRDLLDEAVACARDMLQLFAMGDLHPAVPDLVARLNQLRERLVEQESATYVGADSELKGETAPEPEAALEAEPEIEAEAVPDAEPEIEAEAEPEIEAEAVPEAEPEIVAEAMPEAEPEIVGEAMPEAEPEPVALAADEPVMQQASAPEPEQIVLPPLEADDEDEGQVEPELINEPESVLVAEAQAQAHAQAQAALQAAAADSVIADAPLGDELDADLLPVFLEEATDLLPELAVGLRQWQGNQSDTAPVSGMLRILHTVKGSARMAGAMRLGQHVHDIETQIENMVHAGTSTPAAFDDLMANYDHAMLLFEQLQNPGSTLAAAPAAGAAPGAAAAPASVDESHAAQSRTPLVRVRADILDRLVNQAGEVSITRSKLENQVSTLKSSLTDFSENLARLRRQLREVEMQAESQIASRMSIAGEREFDPLEFDRFTRLQELTRGMAESVNDVASFHESLTRTVDGATADLNVQSRLTRDLQQDLMRVRMVPFSSLSERLFRVARQTAKEIDKRVNLDIRGGSVEIDRSVLEQMAAPFEHLLRNSIVHGIESREKRGESGKSDTGELLVQVSQQGNEVVIQFSDDGAGLNLERIRSKALENGLISPDAVVSDAEVANLIFEAGFSTADALTELAGRGVGMDVVRSEAVALGGRVSIATETGKGARFSINLPLTLAVTQVVLTTSGTKTYALPSILVEQVLQIKEAPLNQSRADGFIMFQGEKVKLHFLPNLLGDADAHPMVQRSGPVLVLKNGTDRLAVQVDDIQGNREVVIKNIGPQLSRMIGIAGATVMGSGEIVLILNPVALSHHLDLHPQLKPRAAIAMAAVQETPARDYVVMVVDDSLTVRKVTQRLLEREGYQVMLAKDGVDALEKLQENVPDLMLVDIEMPRMDGFDLTRNIRGNASTEAVPIIMITSRTADKHRNYAIDLGVNAYFGKPFQEDMLLAAIGGLLKREMAVES